MKKYSFCIMVGLLATFAIASDASARTRLLGAASGSFVCFANENNVGFLDAAHQDPKPSPESIEQKAARDRQMAERHAEMTKRAAEQKARTAERKAERNASRAKRGEELKAKDAERAAQRRVEFAKRTADQKARVEKQRAVREAAAARRAADADRRRAREGTFRFLGSRVNAHFNRVVKGAPYSALAITEHIQKLVDGNQIVRRNEISYYRDGEGRTRIEQSLNTIGKWSAAGDAPKIIAIGDPVSGEYYSLDPRTRVATKDAELGRRLQQQGLRRATTVEKDKSEEKSIAKDSKSTITSDGRRKTEKLGSRSVEGVTAEGTRTTTTIPAGEIGNTLEIAITDESWFSTELQTLVKTEHHDPRSGDTVYRLTNISRREPDQSLFRVPSDYTIVDRSAPMRAPAKSKPEKDKESRSQIF